VLCFQVVFVGLPVLQGLETIEAFAEAEHILSLLAPLVLQVPGGRVAEVEHVESTRSVEVEEQVAVGDIRVSTHLFVDRVDGVGVFVDSAGSEEVSESGPACFLLFRNLRIEADQHVDDDLGRVIHDIHALLDGRVDVDVPSNTTILVITVSERSGIPHIRHRCGSDGSVLEIAELGVVLIEHIERPGLDVCGSDRDLLLVAFGEAA